MLAFTNLCSFIDFFSLHCIEGSLCLCVPGLYHYTDDEPMKCGEDGLHIAPSCCRVGVCVVMAVLYSEQRELFN